VVEPRRDLIDSWYSLATNHRASDRPRRRCGSQLKPDPLCGIHVRQSVILATLAAILACAGSAERLPGRFAVGEPRFVWISCRSEEPVSIRYLRGEPISAGGAAGRMTRRALVKDSEIESIKLVETLVESSDGDRYEPELVILISDDAADRLAETSPAIPPTNGLASLVIYKSQIEIYVGTRRTLAENPGGFFENEIGLSAVFVDRGSSFESALEFSKTLLGCSDAV